MTFTLGRRSLATTLVIGIATLGVTGAAHAATATKPAKPATSQHAGFLGGGLFKTVFGIFGAVRAQVPTIAAPVIADAVTAKTITQAQADALTALLSGTRTNTAATTAKAFGGGDHAGVKLAPEQVKVLSAVMAAVQAKLPEIAKPIIDKAIADGDLTQKQADMITKVIALVSSFKPGGFLKPSVGATTVKSPLTALEKQVAKKVKKAARHKAKKRGARSRKARRAAR